MFWRSRFSGIARQIHLVKRLFPEFEVILISFIVQFKILSIQIIFIQFFIQKNRKNKQNERQLQTPWFNYCDVKKEVILTSQIYCLNIRNIRGCHDVSAGNHRVIQKCFERLSTNQKHTFHLD